jgi:aldehyde dehydrogenase (NAD+)
MSTTNEVMKFGLNGEEENQPPRWPMLIGGEWTAGTDDRWDDVVSPSRKGSVLAQVPRAGARDVEAAVQAARAAFPGWRALHFAERQRALLHIAEAVEEASEELALLTAADTGNALRTQARPESQTLVSLFRYFAGLAGEFKGQVLPAGDGQLQYTRREPLGVVAAVLPWNSPLMLAGAKVPAALAAGNTVVLKPAEDAPLTVLRLAQIAAAHLPAGVLNVVTGPGEEAGDCLVRHEDVDKVSFTGSTAVGRHVASVTGSRLAPVSLELGGKSPNIVFPSAGSGAKLKETVAGVITSMRLTRQGQSCTAGSRLFVHREVYDEFMKELVAQASQLKVGDPLEESTDMGAIINEKQYETIRSYVEDGKRQPGVDVLLDGSGYSHPELDGYFQAPTILGAAENSWRVAREEIFGPVLVAIPWDDREEVIKMANDSHYGLAAYVWTSDLNEALDTAHRIESGWVQVNQGGGQVVGQSYGGYKASGIGRELSLEGALEAFSQLKQINVKI